MSIVFENDVLFMSGCYVVDNGTKRSRQQKTNRNFKEDYDIFKFVRHVSILQTSSSVTEYLKNR